MKSIILCADYGTRFYPLTKEAPRALLPVRGRPVLKYICDKIQLLDNVDEMFITVNNRFFGQFKEWLDSYHTRIPIRLINDGSKNYKNRLGAIGDLALTVKRGNISDDVLVTGGDNLFDFGLSDFVKHSLESPGPVIGVYNINGKCRARRYGIVKTDDRSKVIDFYEKPSRVNDSRLISLCLYYFPKQTLPLLDEYINYTLHPMTERSPEPTASSRAKSYELRAKSRAKSQEPTTELNANRYPLQPKADPPLAENANLDSIGNYIKWLAKNSCVYSYKFDGAWFDIGDIDSYTEAVCSF